MKHGQSQSRWACGPGEILRHGLSLLENDSDINRRLAMISIDNSVELMIQTYLGLPKRITGLSVTRKEYQGMAESFPALLDGLETYAPEKLDGIDLGTIEWYHRLRNELYHQGNGLTVERDKVEVYAELANLLFRNLFGDELVPHIDPETALLGEVIGSWATLEVKLRDMASNIAGDDPAPAGLIGTLQLLRDANGLNVDNLRELDNLRRLRNEVVHGQTNHRKLLTRQIIERVEVFIKLFM
jgi:hypothetical protein